MDLLQSLTLCLDWKMKRFWTSVKLTNASVFLLGVFIV